MDGEKAGAGASFQSWLRGDGSPGLHPIEYREGPPYVGKGLQALVKRCIHSNREGVALLMSDPNHRFSLAVIHLVAMEERWGYSFRLLRGSELCSFEPVDLQDGQETSDPIIGRQRQSRLRASKGQGAATPSGPVAAPPGPTISPCLDLAAGGFALPKVQKYRLLNLGRGGVSDPTRGP
uniref:Uncharacterized protein n=1 Tax=Chromera velia CCMP2878 TaxID=1169474 RepID=A0A0G4FVD7_9ALVE|eukprot:Cvel_18969.t1-p1 / transcript=Cvel_18969.t1 / gene=Cvel_18969 / organism=Chromera_velia_CCMP2878 / gene_product=hypothetical protein / transcript_product=hypothetical protein / location=Cvel_scaffold1603:30866-34336(-) / protein_length=178 / sequence_SO=supercontig / SO=protein_coding / is_pseudo=false